MYCVVWNIVNICDLILKIYFFSLALCAIDKLVKLESLQTNVLLVLSLITRLFGNNKNIDFLPTLC